MHKNKRSNERGEITANTAEIEKIIKEYYEHFYANKLDNLEKINKFLETYSLWKLSQEETDNLNRPITRSEIELAIKILKKPLCKTEVKDQMASLGNSTKDIKKNLLFSNNPKKLKIREHSQIHSMRPPSPWYQNQTKTIKKRKL